MRSLRASHLALAARLFFPCRPRFEACAPPGALPDTTGDGNDLTGAGGEPPYSPATQTREPPPWPAAQCFVTTPPLHGATRPMRFTGTVKTWNEARGFGFLTPSQGGQDIFVHISALPKGAGVPRPGQAFTFEIELNRDGKKRAVKVQDPEQSAAPARPRAGDPPHRARAPTPPRRTRPLSSLVISVLVVATASVVYTRFAGRPDAAAPTAAEQTAIMEPSSSPPPRTALRASPAPQAYRCDGRQHCSQMNSCAEAEFFLAHCPGVKMDGNGDGTPCEEQWCGH